MEKQTAVEWLQVRYNRRQVYEESIYDEEFEQAKAIQKEQIEKYAEFCVRCDREGLKLIHFNDYIKL
jgi:hypothetical protein